VTPVAGATLTVYSVVQLRLKESRSQTNLKAIQVE